LGSRAGAARQRLSIEAVRWLRQDIVSRPILSRWKVQIVDEADLLSEAAPDAFLKTLEEPPASAVIMLVASSLEALPETIRSRCQHVQLGLAPKSMLVAELTARGVTEAQAAAIAAVARGRVATALELAAQPEALERWRADVAEAFACLSEPLARLRLAGPLAANHTKDRERTFTLLDHCAGLWRDALIVQAGLVDNLAYPHMRERLAAFAGELGPEQIARALRATRRAAHDLERNFQARIALLAMINLWPDLPERP
jgi:DNA polymerase-3 subunit delta'